jgi:hypothetical protein
MFNQGEPNEPIDLGEYRVAIHAPSLGLSSANVSNVWRLRQTFSPSPRLELTADVSLPVAGLLKAVMGHDENRYVLEVRGESPVHLSLVSGSSSHATLEAMATPCQLYPPADDLIEARFSLFNWPLFALRRMPADRAVMSFAVGSWVIDVESVPDIEGRLKALARVGGYAMTHTAAVRRADGQRFTSRELDELLDGLHHYFSFALGKWAGPQLATATNARGEESFLRAGVGHLSDGPSWRYVSWVDTHHVESLVMALPGFLALFENPIWREALHGVVYFYVNANSLGRGVNVDTSALFTQAALEQLAWTLCVEDRGLVLPTRFKNPHLSAADQIRLLCTSLGVPLSVPAELPGLCRSDFEKEKPFDLAVVLTQLRNRVTHPRKGSPLHEDAWYHGWMAAQWLIEMIVLRLSNYSGVYAKRFPGRHVGTVDRVPWASAANAAV